MSQLHTVRTAEGCRDRAREFFALAVAEDDLEQREAWLEQGERWMTRWRYWRPELNIVDREADFYRKR
jgi:hypothetical protein